MMSPPPPPSQAAQACRIDQPVPLRHRMPSSASQAYLSHPYNDSAARCTVTPALSGSLDIPRWSQPAAQMASPLADPNHLPIPHSLLPSVPFDPCTNYFPHGGPTQPRLPPRVSSRASISSASVAPMYDPTAAPRSAAEQYMKSMEPRVTMGDKVLKEVAVLSQQIAALHATCDAVQVENRQLRDKLHEMQIGQRALATRAEVTEEIAAQLAPAFQDLVQAMQDKFDKSNVAVPEMTSNLTVNKTHRMLLGMKEAEMQRLQRETVANQAQQPLIGLLSHLIVSLQPLQKITSTVSQLQEFSGSMRDIALFKEAMSVLMAKASNLAPLPAITTLNANETPVSNGDILKRLEELQSEIDGMSMSGKVDQLLTLVTRFGSQVDELASRRCCQPISDFEGSTASGPVPLTSRHPGHIHLDPPSTLNAFAKLARIELLVEDLVSKDYNFNDLSRSSTQPTNASSVGAYVDTPLSRNVSRGLQSQSTLSESISHPIRHNVQHQRGKENGDGYSPSTLTRSSGTYSCRGFGSGEQDVFGRKQDIPQHNHPTKAKTHGKQGNKRTASIASQLPSVQLVPSQLPASQIPASQMSASDLSANQSSRPAKRSRTQITESIIRTRAQRKFEDIEGDASSPLTDNLTEASQIATATNRSRANTRHALRPRNLDPVEIFSSSEERRRSQARAESQKRRPFPTRLSSPQETQLSQPESLLAETQALEAVNLGTTQSQSSLIEGQQPATLEQHSAVVPPTGSVNK